MSKSISFNRLLRKALAQGRQLRWRRCVTHIQLVAGRHPGGLVVFSSTVPANARALNQALLETVSIYNHPGLLDLEPVIELVAVELLKPAWARD